MNNTIKNILKMKRKFMCPFTTEGVTSNINLVKAINLEVIAFGYTLSAELIIQLESLTKEDLQKVYKFLMGTLSEMVGDKVCHKPLFVNFPNDVPDEFEYLISRVTGYLGNFFGIEKGTLLSCGHYIDEDKFDLKKFGACPICQRQVDEDIGQGDVKLPLSEITPLKIIDLVGCNYGFELFENILNKKSMSSMDKQYVENFVEDYWGKDAFINPKDISSKENKTFLLNILYRKGKAIRFENWFKSSTDVLRFINAINNGDVSLKERCYYKSMSRKLRKSLLNMLNKVGTVDDMWNYKEHWIILGQLLHPGEYKKKFPKANSLFNIIREVGNSKCSFNYKLDKALKERNINKMVELLKDKPSLYARYLDIMLRYGLKGFILDVFIQIIDKVEINILLTLWKYFKTRNKNQDFRYFFPKGNVTKVKILEEDNRKYFLTDDCCHIRDIIEKEIVYKRFSERESLGKVYIDPNLEKVILPFNSRGDSTSLNPMTKGSRIKMLDKETIRMFCHWKGDCDVDLSVAFYDEEWRKISHVSYTNLKTLGVVHSGDIQRATNGATEFIDIDRSDMDERIRYAVMGCIVYSGDTFDNIEETFAGVMMRDQTNEGQIFEPKTIEHKFDIEANAKYVIPMIFDLKENEIIWTDLALKGKEQYNRVENANENLIMIGKVMTRLTKDKVTVKELIDLNVQVRGEYTNNIEDADIKIGLYGGDYSLLDIEKLLKDFL